MIYIVSSALPKRWIGNEYLTLQCDVTNSVHPVTMMPTRHCCNLKTTHQGVATLHLGTSGINVRVIDINFT